MANAITINSQQLGDVKKLLNGIEKDARTALRRAINKTATAARTATTKGIGSVVTMKAKKIKEYVTVQKARNDNLSARLKLRGVLTPAILFTNSQLAKGVSIKIFKAESPFKYRHAFYATMPSGHIGIYLRKEISPGKYAKRLPIKELFGPAVTAIYEKHPGLADKIETEAAERLVNETNNQINYILSRYG